MSGEFVACMEDVPDLYAEPYDPERPVVCFDETSKLNSSKSAYHNSRIAPLSQQAIFVGVDKKGQLNYEVLPPAR